ncbi:hypothetical protein RB601_002979 [Gaeumannomyces tritici]
MSTSLSLPPLTATSACSSAWSVISAQVPTPTAFSSQFAAASTDPCATIGLETVNPEAFSSYAADLLAIMSRNAEYVVSATVLCSDFLVSTAEAEAARSRSCLATRTGANATVTSTTTSSTGTGTTGQPGTTAATTSRTTGTGTGTGTGQPAGTTTGSPGGSAGWTVRSSVGLLAGAVFAVGMFNM